MHGQALRRVKVWDGWVRLCHWAIVLLVAASWITAETGLDSLHAWSGYTVLALLLFRIGWGFVGSDTARFSRFLRSPRTALAHLRHFRQPGPDTEIGHNAAGGWMVLGLLGVLLLQTGTGLFANEEPGFDYGAHGPLALLLSDRWSDRLTWVHNVNFNLIIAAAALHVLAVLAYALLKRHDLVRPMVTGWKLLPATMQAPRLGHPAVAVVLLALAALAVWRIVAVGG
jgi:cytochrome b